MNWEGRGTCAVLRVLEVLEAKLTSGYGSINPSWFPGQYEGVLSLAKSEIIYTRSYWFILVLSFPVSGTSCKLLLAVTQFSLVLDHTERLPRFSEHPLHARVRRGLRFCILPESQPPDGLRVTTGDTQET